MYFKIEDNKFVGFYEEKEKILILNEHFKKY